MKHDETLNSKRNCHQSPVVISLCIRIGILGDEAGEEDKESDRRVSKLRKDRRIAVMVPNDNATNHKLPASVPEFKETGFLSTTEYCSHIIQRIGSPDPQKAWDGIVWDYFKNVIKTTIKCTSVIILILSLESK